MISVTYFSMNVFFFSPHYLRTERVIRKVSCLCKWERVLFETVKCQGWSVYYTDWKGVLGVACLGHMVLRQFQYSATAEEYEIKFGIPVQKQISVTWYSQKKACAAFQSNQSYFVCKMYCFNFPLMLANISLLRTFPKIHPIYIICLCGLV